MKHRHPRHDVLKNLFCYAGGGPLCDIHATAERGVVSSTANFKERKAVDFAESEY